MNVFNHLHIWLLFINCQFPGGYFFRVSSYSCLLYYRINPFGCGFIYWTKISILLLSFWNFADIIIKWLRVKNYFQRLLLWVSFLHKLHFKMSSFGVLVLILAPLIFDLFVLTNQISVHWSRNLSPGVIENFLWDVSKLYICILLPLQAYGRLWRGWRLGVTARWHQLIDFIGIKYPLSYSRLPIFVDFWLLYIVFTG